MPDVSCQRLSVRGFISSGATYVFVRRRQKPSIMFVKLAHPAGGWGVRLIKDLAMEALRRAIVLRRPPPGLIHHSDRGSQYCSAGYRRMLRDHHFVVSMSGRGNCYDNAMVETVFKTIKAELIWRTAFATRDDASKAIGQYIEGFYNPRRRHSSLGYVSPATFEATFRAGKKEEQMALH